MSTPARSASSSTSSRVCPAGSAWNVLKIGSSTTGPGVDAHDAERHDDHRARHPPAARVAADQADGRRRAEPGDDGADPPRDRLVARVALPGLRDEADVLRALARDDLQRQDRRPRRRSRAPRRPPRRPAPGAGTARAGAPAGARRAAPSRPSSIDQHPAVDRQLRAPVVPSAFDLRGAEVRFGAHGSGLDHPAARPQQHHRQLCDDDGGDNCRSPAQASPVHDRNCTRCRSRSSPTSTATATPSRRCSPTPSPPAPTRCGASATSSATAPSPTPASSWRAAMRRSAWPATTTWA